MLQVAPIALLRYSQRYRSSCGCCQSQRRAGRSALELHNGDVIEIITPCAQSQSGLAGFAHGQARSKNTLSPETMGLAETQELGEMAQSLRRGHPARPGEG
jgi:hypothetical protein